MLRTLPRSRAEACSQARARAQHLGSKLEALVDRATAALAAVQESRAAAQSVVDTLFAVERHESEVEPTKRFLARFRRHGHANANERIEGLRWLAADEVGELDAVRIAAEVCAARARVRLERASVDADAELEFLESEAELQTQLALCPEGDASVSRVADASVLRVQVSTARSEASASASTFEAAARGRTTHEKSMVSLESTPSSTPSSTSAARTSVAHARSEAEDASSTHEFETREVATRNAAAADERALECLSMLTAPLEAPRVYVVPHTQRRRVSSAKRKRGVDIGVGVGVGVDTKAEEAELKRVPERPAGIEAALRAVVAAHAHLRSESDADPARTRVLDQLRKQGAALCESDDAGKDIGARGPELGSHPSRGGDVAENQRMSTAENAFAWSLFDVKEWVTTLRARRQCAASLLIRAANDTEAEKGAHSERVPRLFASTGGGADSLQHVRCVRADLRGIARNADAWLQAALRAADAQWLTPEDFRMGEWALDGSQAYWVPNLLSGADTHGVLFAVLALSTRHATALVDAGWDGSRASLTRLPLPMHMRRLAHCLGRGSSSSRYEEAEHVSALRRAWCDFLEAPESAIDTSVWMCGVRRAIAAPDVPPFSTSAARTLCVVRTALARVWIVSVDSDAESALFYEFFKRLGESFRASCVLLDALCDATTPPDSFGFFDGVFFPRPKLLMLLVPSGYGWHPPPRCALSCDVVL